MTMKANFIDSSGRGYYISSYSIGYIGSQKVFKDGEGNVLIGVDELPLKEVDPKDDIEPVFVATGTVKIKYGKEARERDMKGIREIATRHARSQDGRHERWKSIKRELG